MQPDDELVLQVQRGQHTMYGQLVERYQKAVRVVTLGVLGDSHEAEDAAQDAFVIAFRKIATLRDRARFGFWLLRIAKRCAVERRGQRPKTLLLDAVAGLPALTDESSLLADEQELASMLARRLPRHEFVAVSLRYMDGLSVKEISEVTGRSVGTVTKQISRAIARLREESATTQSERNSS